MPEMISRKSVINLKYLHGMLSVITATATPTMMVTVWKAIGPT